MTALVDSLIATANGIVHLLVVLPVPVTIALVAGAIGMGGLAAAEIEELARASRKPEVPRH